MKRLNLIETRLGSGTAMEHEWSSVGEFEAALRRQLEKRHPGLVTRLSLLLDGDTIVLHGEVGSEDCKGDAKRLALGFDGVFKVRNVLIVAAFLHAASDDDMDNYFGSVESVGGKSGPVVGSGLPPAGPEPADWDPFKIDFVNSADSTMSGVAGYDDMLSNMVDVERRPSIEATGSIEPGELIRIAVDLSIDADTGSAPMTIGRFPSDWQTILVTVHLFAPWATDIEAEVAEVVITADGTSQPARFNCRVSADYVVGQPAQVQALFLHGTRVCGYETRNLAASTATRFEVARDPNAVAAPRSASVAIVPDAIGPSVSISISCDGKGQQTWMWAAQVPGGVEQDSERIDLGGDDRSFAETLIRTCPDMATATFRRSMAGVGERIWAAAPARFQSGYLTWRAKLGPNFPIQFVTDDPHVPWEMMKPNVDGTDHLFLTHPIARWPLTRTGRRRHVLPGGVVMSFVPEYEDGRDLPSASAEGDWVCTALNGWAKEATSTTFLDVLDGVLGIPVGILHFAGHGAIDTGLADGGIDMEDRMVGVVEVDQSRVRLGQRHGTLVVLNACETAAGARLLGMNTGWGAAIAAREFGGLIAPLWEVQDDVALAMIKAALPPLIAREATLGGCLTAARYANRDSSISAFAYLAHGDVMARFARS